MGKPKQWDAEWHGGAWRQPPSSSSYAYKGQAKGKGKYKARDSYGWHKDGNDEVPVEFPSFEAMKPVQKSQKTKGDENVDADETPTIGRYVNGVQKIVNGLRKAETRQRKLEGETEELEAK